jgi:hypothetical protein
MLFHVNNYCYYYEDANSGSYIVLGDFTNKLLTLEKILSINNNYFYTKTGYLGNKHKIKKYFLAHQKSKKIIKVDPISNAIKIYVLGYLLWPENLLSGIKEKKFPSAEFINIIMSLHTIRSSHDTEQNNSLDNVIINPPPLVSHRNEQSLFLKQKYILFESNKLHILDALFEQGSKNIYACDQCSKRYEIKSEHVGTIEIKKNEITDIIISARAGRINVDDEGIFYPEDIDSRLKQYIFHTHPMEGTVGGRIDNDILLEVPSSNDIVHFIYTQNKHGINGSKIIAPEGLYLIRNIVLGEARAELDHERLNKINEDLNRVILHELKVFCDKYKKKWMSMSEPQRKELFYSVIINDYSCITAINKKLSEYNIYVEYYPRIMFNGNWILRSFNLLVFEQWKIK